MENNLPNNWTVVELGVCCDILDNIRVPINSDERAKRQGHIPYYGATGQVGWIDDYLFNEELVLVGEDGAPFFDKSKNIAFRIEGKSWVNNHAHVLKARGVTSNKFLEHYLNSFNFSGYVNGTTRLKLTQGKLREIPVLLPPFAEQLRIVKSLDSLLARVNSSKARLDRIPTLLKKFRQSVLAAAIRGELTKEFRNEGEELRNVKLGVLINELKYGTSQKSDYNISGVPVLRIPNIGENGRILNEDLKFAILSESEYEKLKLEEGDILIIRSNGSVSFVGKSAIVTKSQVGFAYAGYLIRIRCNRELLNPAYLNYVMLSNELRTQIEIEARSTSGVNNINSDEVKELLIPVPAKNEQNEIVRKIEKLFHFADSVELRYQKAKAFFDRIPQALLAKAFRGELVEQDEHDEPASVLLERIKTESEALKSQKKEKKANKIAERKSQIAVARKNTNVKKNKNVA